MKGGKVIEAMVKLCVIFMITVLKMLHLIIINTRDHGLSQNSKEVEQTVLNEKDALTKQLIDVL